MVQRLVGAGGRPLRAPLPELTWLTPALALGDAPDSRALGRIRRLGISSILDLRPASEQARDPNWGKAVTRPASR